MPETQEKKQMDIAFASVGLLGHFKPMVPFIREIHERGHKVTVFVGSNPKYENELVNEGIVRGENVEIINVELPGIGDFKGKIKGPRDLIDRGGPFAILSENLYPSIMSHYKNKQHPDALVHGFFATAAADAADSLQVPAVTVCPNPLSYDSNPAPGKRGIRNRINAFFIDKVMLGSILFKILKGFRNKERSLRNLPKLKSQDVFPSTSQPRHMISTTGDGFEFIQKRSALLNLVGPSPPKNPDPLGSELESWINAQEKPILYVAFGTAYEFDEESLAHLSSELSKLSDDVSILWSLPANQQNNLPPNLPKTTTWRFETFVPQWSVLKHPSVKMFITHCGSNSVYESLLNHVPMIACPTGADQFANGARINAAGVGLVVKKGASGNVAEVVRAVRDDLPSFEDAAKRVKEMFDKQGGEKKGSDIIETVARQWYKEPGLVTPLKL